MEEVQGRKVGVLQEKRSTGYVYLVTAIAAVGGFLFGFDTAIIAGAIGFIKDHFQLNAIQEGFAVGSVLIGCMVGASMAGVLSDRLGRKKILLSAAFVFVVAAVLSAIPRTLEELVVARFLIGLAVGIESMLSPMYIAEVAPAGIRGRLVTLNHVALTVGMLSAYIVDWRLAGLDPAYNWRMMFASGAVPAFIFLVALLLVPESPRWLAKQGLDDRAFSVLARIGGRDHAQAEIAEIKGTIASEAGSVLQLVQPGLRIALMLGVVLAIMQQVTGINTILYYAPEVFKKAGYATSNALLVSIFVGVVILAGNIAALQFIDRIGRRPLLIGGVTSMAIFLGLIGLSFYSDAFPPVWTVVFVLGYVGSFMVGLGPGFWLVLSEIFPTRVRGRAMSIGTFFIWVSCFVVAQTFPTLIEKITIHRTFWLYSVMCVLTIAFISRFVPETKGKSLEEIEKLWRPPDGS